MDAHPWSDQLAVAEMRREGKIDVIRAAIPLPPGAQMADIHAVRAIAYDRPTAEGKPPAPTTPVHLTRINKVFILDGEYLPSRSRFAWQGSATLAPAGPPLDMPVP